MKRTYLSSCLVVLLLLAGTAQAQFGQPPQQEQNPVVTAIVEEATGNSQLERLAHELLDVVGPRLVGTPQMQNAHDWAVSTYEGWGIQAENEQYGQWTGWRRGVTHVDLVAPRVVSLNGMQMAWSPGTDGPVTGEVTMIPDVADSAAFRAWLPSAAGKFVLVNMMQPTGRPGYNWEEYGTEESIARMEQMQDEADDAWDARIERTGLSLGGVIDALEEAGAAGILQSRWSGGFGVNKVFSAATDGIPHIDLSLEDYGLLYRLVDYGNSPQIRVNVESEELGKVPAFNTIATIPGTEKPDEYIILSAHFDSWDGGTGATDNGTGTITMMEAARILKQVYPNPKRTIIVGLWGGEEQGLNGSRAYVEDHPEIVEGVQALFNQDNGTGRVVNISGQGFLHAYAFLGDWLSAVPWEVRSHINTNFPGTPGGGGSDYASFVSAGAPAFSLSSLSWDYGTYTWHTNLDTYDKIVFDDVRNNVILTAVLTFMASEDPDTFSREKRVMPISPWSGERMSWPQVRTANRDGGN
ncbi:MAG: M20/M25/M40 family metallo-hydrolase [Balneolaceae bacterium]|nr:M20/M25/M40 family metallo-hydrolase [Balneolaceae bacterium]